MGTLNINNKKLLVIENFLPNLQEFLPEIHKIHLYKNDEFIQKFQKQNWPGKRSNSLYDENKFLFFLILQNLNKVCFLKKYIINIYVHLRGEEDYNKDWIHKDDPNDYSFLIYLNKTNVNSGTYFYDEEENITSDIKYVQNRFVIYDALYNHMGYGHFGKTPENGRLTINGFLKVVE